MARLLVNGWQSPVLSRRRSIGNVGIPQEFPRGVRRVGSRYFGFPCFPLLGIPTLACRLGLARNFASDDIGVCRYLTFARANRSGGPAMNKVSWRSCK